MMKAPVRPPFPLAALSATFLAACSAGKSLASPGGAIRFVCQGGATFSVRHERDRARIATSEGEWTFHRRRSSIGRKYVAGDATFIHDEDRAALNGLAGGPFRQCREATAQEEAAGAGGD